MKNFRLFGNPPYKVVAVHGGPGARGEMAPVAIEIAKARGVIEPFQTATTVDGQIDELGNVIKEQAQCPVTLVGFSWGAWLCFMLAARYPELVGKLILVDSAPFEPEYATKIMETRLKRLGNHDMQRVLAAIEILNDPDAYNKVEAFSDFGHILSKADIYDPIDSLNENLDLTDYSPDIFQIVWNEADKMRADGRLLELADHIRCPVTAIHGDYDPHPAEGVAVPLSRYIADFHFILISHCGHKPWIERQARDTFYTILENEIASRS